MKSDWELDGEPMPDPHIPKDIPKNILRRLDKRELQFWIETGELPHRFGGGMDEGGDLQSKTLLARVGQA